MTVVSDDNKRCRKKLSMYQADVLLKICTIKVKNYLGVSMTKSELPRAHVCGINKAKFRLSYVFRTLTMVHVDLARCTKTTGTFIHGLTLVVLRRCNKYSWRKSYAYSSNREY